MRRNLSLSNFLALAAAACCSITLPANNTVEAHSKVFCTDTLVKNGIVVGCRGWPNEGSHYVHIWGPKNMDGHKAPSGGIDQVMLSEVIDKSRPMTTGKLPPMNQVARVAPGGKLVITWSTNNHGGPNQILTDPKSSEGKPVKFGPDVKDDPVYADWNAAPILLTSGYRNTEPIIDVAKKGSGIKTQCQTVFEGEASFLGQMMQQYWIEATWGIQEPKLCWNTLTIPKSMKPGLTRLLYKWVSTSNDVWFFDRFYVDITPSYPALGKPPVKSALSINASKFPKTILSKSTKKISSNKILQHIYLPQVMIPVEFEASVSSTIVIELFESAKKKIGGGRIDVYPSSGNVTINCVYDVIPDSIKTVGVEMWMIPTALLHKSVDAVKLNSTKTSFDIIKSNPSMKVVLVKSIPSLTVERIENSPKTLSVLNAADDNDDMQLDLNDQLPAQQSQLNPYYRSQQNIQYALQDGDDNIWEFDHNPKEKIHESNTHEQDDNGDDNQLAEVELENQIESKIHQIEKLLKTFG